MFEVGTVIGAFGVVLVDRQGQLLISSRRPLGEPLPKRPDLSTQERVFGFKLLQDILTQDSEWSVEVRFEPSGVAAHVTLHISAAIDTDALRLPA